MRRTARLLALLSLAAYAWYLGVRPVYWAPWGGVHDATPLDLNAEPIQAPLTADDPPSIVVRHRGAAAVLTPRQRYDIAGHVVLSDLYFTDALAPVAPVDLSLVWGPLANPAVTRTFSFHHFSRFGSFQWHGSPGVDIATVQSHFSNNHLIPATGRIKQALTSVDPGDNVFLSGYLVDITMSAKLGGAGFQAHTSLLRTDTGAGACEIFYVQKVRINDTWY